MSSTPRTSVAQRLLNAFTAPLTQAPPPSSSRGARVAAGAATAAGGVSLATAGLIALGAAVILGAIRRERRSNEVAIWNAGFGMPAPGSELERRLRKDPYAAMKMFYGVCS